MGGFERKYTDTFSLHQCLVHYGNRAIFARY